MTDRDAAVVAAAMSAMERYTGVVPGYRRAHAQGHGFVGSFEATDAVAALTVAEHLQGGAIPVVVRLSNGAGSPYAPDLASRRRGTTLGLGVEFALPSGGRTTWGAPNIASFPASTPEQFVAVTTAQRRNARGRLDPLRLVAYAARHPRSLAGLWALISRPPIRSFAAADFHGLHAYHLVAADGGRRAFRYRWVSTMAGPRNLTREERAHTPPQYLVEEMRRRLERGPVRWRLILQLAAHGDPTHDQARAWPSSRPTIEAGALTLTAEHPDQDLVERMVFDPTNLPAGIECSDDPLLAFRSAVYHASHAARTSERRGQAVRP